MTDSMVEQVAKAISDAAADAAQDEDEYCTPAMARAGARAAIAALREPSDHMVYAGMVALDESQTPGTKISTVSWGTHIRIYQAMIDAARS
jgi:hypothetical protein